MDFNIQNPTAKYFKPLFFHYTIYYLQSRAPSFASSFQGETVGLICSNFVKAPLELSIYPSITYDLQIVHFI